jgi:DNA (cytosine-5)-methyltransferase 1
VKSKNDPNVVPRRVHLARRNDPVRGLDLFAGAGGLTLGMKAAGVETVAAVEIEPYRVATFRTHTPRAEIINDDIQNVGFAEYRGRVELVYGGPPCQPFSSGGLRKASDDKRDMIPAFLRVVREVEPEAFLMENVPGLATGDRMEYLSRIIVDLTELGFRLSWQVVNAADHGVPQKRRRLFVVGLRHRTFRFPTPTHGPERAHPFVAVRDVLPDPDVSIGEPNPAKVFFAKNPDLRPSPYDGHVFNGGGRPIDPSRPCHTILASAGGNKTHFFDTLGLVPEYHAHLMAGGKPKAGTLDGGRRLTVEESAAIQTFPRSVEFSGPRSSRYHQVGDAVPPRLAEALGRALVEQMRLPAEPDTIRRSVQKTLFR